MVRREELREKLWPHTYVDFDRCINAAVTQLRKTLDDPSDNPRFIETRYRLGYRFAAPVKTWNGAERLTHQASTTFDIAVLPFDSSCGDSEMELLSDRITENVITCLSRVSGVRVIGSSCVFRYRGPGIDPLALGHDLNSRAVLTGWIARRRDGDGVTIGTELVDVPGGWRLWGEQYDLKLSDTFQIQTEIAKDICEKLRHGLTESGAESHRLFGSCPCAT